MSRTAPALLLVAGAAALCMAPGLGLRDLAGDELWGGPGPEAGPFGIVAASLDAGDPERFTAHAPLSWLARWVALAVLGRDHVLPWRLHAVLAAIATAMVTWWVAARHGRPREGLLAGLLLATSPLLAFHARESSNYALTPLLTVVLLGGLVGLARGTPRAWLWLAGGVVLGLANDFLFAFMVAAAVAPYGLVVWRAEDRPAMARPLARAATACAVVLAVPAVVLTWNVLRNPLGDVITPHADPAGTHTWVQSVAGVLRGVFVAPSGGYAAEVVRDRWGTVALVVAGGVLLGVLLWRRADPLARLAAAALAAFVLLHVIAHLVFVQVWDRDFVSGPRSLVAALPLGAVVWACGARQLGPRLGHVLLGGLLTLQGVATARLVTDISDTHRGAVERIEDLWQDGDGIVADPGLRQRLAFRTSSRDIRAHDGCVGDPSELPDRLWYLDAGDGWQSLEIQDCEGRGRRLLDAGGYRLRLWEARSPPLVERGSSSFIEGVVVALLERGRDPGRAPRSILDLRVHPAALSGVRTSAVEVDERQLGTGYRTSRTRPWLPALDFSVLVGAEVLVRVRPAEPVWSKPLPEALAAPYRRPTAAWKARPVVEEPIDGVWELDVPPLTSPLLLVLLRLLRIGLGIGVLAAVSWQSLETAHRRRGIVRTERP